MDLICWLSRKEPKVYYLEHFSVTIHAHRCREGFLERDTKLHCHYGSSNTCAKRYPGNILGIVSK